MASKLATDIGEKIYEFNTPGDLYKAKEMYNKHKGNQKAFELAMENAGMSFFTEVDDLISQF